MRIIQNPENVDKIQDAIQIIGKEYRIENTGNF
jgi:hypothetical protein